MTAEPGEKTHVVRRRPVDIAEIHDVRIVEHDVPRRRPVHAFRDRSAQRIIRDAPTVCGTRAGRLRFPVRVIAPIGAHQVELLCGQRENGHVERLRQRHLMLSFGKRTFLVRSVFRCRHPHRERTRFDAAEHHLRRLVFPVPPSVAVGVRDVAPVRNGPDRGRLSVGRALRHVNDKITFRFHAFGGERDFQIGEDVARRIGRHRRIPDDPALPCRNAEPVSAQRSRRNRQCFAAGAKRNGNVPRLAFRLGKNVIDIDLCAPGPLLTDEDPLERHGLKRKRKDKRRKGDPDQFIHELFPFI